MRELWPIYHEEIPPFLKELAETRDLQRLKGVGMNCGCEYTSFPRFSNIGAYSRFDHSLGVALIVWHFTASMEQAAAGLFHDLTTPVFAHVVDFLNGDHLRQESTEAGVRDWLAASEEIGGILRRYGLEMERVSNYHRYPIADNDAPALSGDRLEYTMGNLRNYGFADCARIQTFYRDLIVGEDEHGRPELVFRTPELAADFARGALQNARVYVADEDRFAMQTLAELLREALERGVLRREALWTEESAVIAALREDEETCEAWERFCGYSRLRCTWEPPEGTGWLRVDAKKRWIDPLVLGRGRVSAWDAGFRRELEAFLKLDFSCWLRGESRGIMGSETAENKKISFFEKTC